jgi:tRNA threonylcarbamoyl adenosine modification protein (Sua5/YciO/YrdC/YwlC family)
MLLSINTENPESRKLRQVVQVLEKGGVIIYPTDTVYGLGCDIFQAKSIEKICRIRGMDVSKANLTIICKDIAQLSRYSKQIDNSIFKVLKKNAPGPFTFILKSGNEAPKIFKSRRKTIGIRIPDNNIAQSIIEELGHPILSISLKSDDEILEYFTDPSEIHDDYHKLVDLVIDGGAGKNIPSAIVDCSDGSIKILREGEVDLKY